jgi:hypothetical protein
MNPQAVQLGTGTLFVADLAAPEPASATAALDAAYREVGYTEEGSSFKYSVTSEAVNVAEELDPIRIVTTGRASSVAFAMAEATRRNLALALNAGAAAANDGTAFDPPAPGDETRVRIVFDSDTGARWIFRQCFQTGEVEIARRKAPAKSLIGVEFKLEKPAGAQPFRVFPTADGLI